MLNKLLLVGRRADENELKFMSNGEVYLFFTIACQRNSKNKNDEYVTDFISLTAFGKKAEYIDKHLKKGKLVSVEATIRNNNYIKNGVKIFQNKIIVESVSILQFVKEDEEDEIVEDFVEEVDYNLDDFDEVE